jgi:hypothetical protein
MVLLSCNDKNNDKTTDDSNSEVNISGKSDYKNDSFYFTYIDSVNNAPDLLEGNSLQYSDQNGTLFSSKVLSDASNRIYKLEMEINEALKTTVSSFYFKNGGKIVSSKIVSHYLEEAVDYLKVISFYTDSGKVIYTGSVKSNNLDSLESARFSSDELENHDHDFSLRMINQTGAFQTTFLGIAFSEELNKNFLIVGPKDGSYRSTLAIYEEIELIKELKSNTNKYKGTPLTIEFENITDPSGLSFQALIYVAIDNVK